MEFKGTKGKWSYNIIDCEDYKDVCVGSKSENEVIARINLDFYEITEQTKANALLISKSPEMLEMLKECVIHLKENDLHGKFTEEIEQLIKEATEL